MTENCASSWSFTKSGTIGCVIIFLRYASERRSRQTQKRQKEKICQITEKKSRNKNNYKTMLNIFSEQYTFLRNP